MLIVQSSNWGRNISDMTMPLRACLRSQVAQIIRVTWERMMVSALYGMEIQLESVPASDRDCLSICRIIPLGEFSQFVDEWL